MKYTYCEKMMWFALSTYSLKYLKQNVALDKSATKKKAKQIYRNMVSKTPDIGSLKENSLRMCLSAGMVWLSLYQAADQKLSNKQFGEMVEASMKSPLVVASFKAKAKSAFTKEAQLKRQEQAVKGNAVSDSPFNWKTEVVLGRDANEYTINYHQCGLCALCKQEHLFHLLPYMCVLDIMSIEWMGGVLYRTKTLAQQMEYCDFYICKKGSKWDLEKQRENSK